ncbi:hypothetical protein JIM95_002460 [Corynebacterium sp. CCM 8835]|uniref:Uncharacterized protein n=1 Tax=Corynebacterium antarcticum TaxID=2800405 RepID=A0A9Q4CBL9_9CORY|nr:hypothetical protein [Corynebacterium antarcticum]MCK7641788.1 hypothetical protein [Corynebacterium antarcticum]MCK7660116.1 hypothetical protein [Corynebacterium antarcticum]MCL0245017.1 hypothetical protein [Corynebacterium antarcticum]MCX7491391.1 hypothetical protein [Corynebacterium antarcticum]MCX7537410.1 hypothetical protein [Corynebacterium antarcticum]
MLIAALITALIGFGLLVMTVQSGSDVYSWLLIVDAAVGLGFLVADIVIKRRRRQDPPED